MVKGKQDSQHQDKPHDTNEDTVKVVLDVLRSLRLVDDTGQGKPKDQRETKNYVATGRRTPEGLYGKDWKPHVASAFGTGGSDKALDDFLSESSKVPIFNVPNARKTSSSNVSYGPVDNTKVRMAAGGGSAFGGNVTGFGRGTPDFSGVYSDSLMSVYTDPFMSNNFSMFNFSLSRANPYMTNRMYGSGMYGDIPVYFLMMQEQNGGLLYWPLNVREKFNWFRYFARTDPFVGAAVDLHTDLPLSRIGFSKPKLKNDPDGRKADACFKRVTKWAEHVDLFKRLMEGFYEWNVIGNAYVFNEWSEEQKWWNRIVLLPPEEMSVLRFPFCDFAFATYRPEPLVRLVSVVSQQENNLATLPPVDRAIYENLPKDVVTSIEKFGAVIMDTNPYTGSFVEHIARKRVPYSDLGISPLERVIIPLLQKEHFKYTQLSLTSRLMTPRNKVNAPGITPEATDFLRSEIDMSMQDPDYHVVTNFDFTWDQIGATDRLIQLQPEYERIENEIISALGITKELVSGEASYGGTRITLDILNTRYLLIRDVFQNFIEKRLLLPMAVANDWYEVDENTGEREYYYPKLTFNRLTIRDNAEVFDALFQLYQKGSLPIKVLYEVFNLDPQEMDEMLVDDMFTPRDATFNELLREVHSNLASEVVANTNVLERVSSALGLKRIDEEGKPKVEPVADLGSDVFLPPDDQKTGPEVQEAPPELEDETPLDVNAENKVETGSPATETEQPLTESKEAPVSPTGD